MNVSLKASGKSRADLWAFATIAAVEYSVETNNMVCDGTYTDYNYHKSYHQGLQCNQWKGTPDCKVMLLFLIRYFGSDHDFLGLIAKLKGHSIQNWKERLH